MPFVDKVKLLLTFIYPHLYAVENDLRKTQQRIEREGSGRVDPEKCTGFSARECRPEFSCCTCDRLKSSERLMCERPEFADACHDGAGVRIQKGVATAGLVR